MKVVIKVSVNKLLEAKEALAPQENPLESSDFYLHCTGAS